MNPLHQSTFLANRREVLRAIAASGVAWALPRERAQAGITNSQPAIGVNLAQIRYWSTERTFNNLFLNSSPHVSLAKGAKWGQGGPLDLDSQGWIRRFRPGQSAAFLIDLNAGHANTVYEVLYRGAPNAIRIRDGQGNNYTKRTSESRLLVRMHNPIRDVIVREKGLRSAETFATRFIDRCRQYHTLRFMDWLGTNDDRSITWETRVTDKYYTQANGEVALEYLIELCNVTSSAMWYCVHHRASDDYVRQAARLMKEKLTNGRPVYVEHSNEVWNGQFPQHDFCKQQEEKWLNYHIRRTAEIAGLFRQEGLEVISVLGLQAAGIWKASEALAQGVPEGIDATAIAPYFGGRVCRDADTVNAIRREGLERVLAECDTEIQKAREHVQKHRELAGKHGLALLGYEGGQHLVTRGSQRKDRGLVELLIQANRHPRMYDLYREYLRMWYQETDNSLMCLFNSMGQPSKSGSWGLMEYEGQPLEQAPKYRAVVDHLSGAA